MTRAMVAVHTERGALCCIHVHGDGYPQGLGRKLAEILETFRPPSKRVARERHRTSIEAGRLAARVIAELTNTSDDAYLCWPDQYFDVYTYRIELLKNESIRLTVTSPDSRVLFEGHPREFLERTVP